MKAERHTPALGLFLGSLESGLPAPLARQALLRVIMLLDNLEAGDASDKYHKQLLALNPGPRLQARLDYLLASRSLEGGSIQESASRFEEIGSASSPTRKRKGPPFSMPPSCCSQQLIHRSHPWTKPQAPPLSLGPNGSSKPDSTALPS
jgi:hypothetical protein